MLLKPAAIPDVLLVEARVHRDGRGFFLETYREDRFRAGGVELRFVQDNHSLSQQGTLRGLHGQRRRPQGKLVRAVEGEIFDVAVDIRRGSPTFGEWVGARLSSENFLQMYVPPGFLHGFCVLSRRAQVEYKVTEFYDPADEYGVIWNDPDLKVDWPIKDPLLSKRDQALPRLSELGDLLPKL